MNEQKQLNLKIDDNLSKGVHATDVLITTSEKDVCRSFYVLLGQGEGVVTARVFLPQITALQMAELIQKQVGPFKQLLDEIVKKMPPQKEGGTSANR